jgi:hypothetical protein
MSANVSAENVGVFFKPTGRNPPPCVRIPAMGCGVLGGGAEMSSGGREIREGAISTVNPGLNEEEEEKPKERRESVRTVVYVYAEANGVKERERDGIFPWRVQPRGKGISTSTDQIRGVGE